MKFSSSDILPVVETTGFDAEILERVLHLLNLLNAFNSHPFLKRKWVLKGGTALNMFVLEFPRLSVDIDLNYIGTLDREEMLKDRAEIERTVQEILSQEGFITKKVPAEHAGGKWRLGYRNFRGLPGTLEVDLNFVFREPLWDIQHLDSYPLGKFQALGIPVINLYELAAGKLTALLSRDKARDLFDCYNILNMGDLEHDRLRTMFVVYGAMARKDWRTVSVKDVKFNEEELAGLLVPTLAVHMRKEQMSPKEYGEELVKRCREGLSLLLPFTDSERAFLDLLLDEGKIDSTVLTSDKTLQKRIENQPSLRWKAINVRKHKGLSDETPLSE